MNRASLGPMLCVPVRFHVASRISINVSFCSENKLNMFKKNCFKNEECTRRQLMIYGAVDMNNTVPACRGLQYRSSLPKDLTNAPRQTCSVNGVLPIS
jgi:hypothetical protein